MLSLASHLERARQDQPSAEDRPSARGRVRRLVGAAFDLGGNSDHARPIAESNAEISARTRTISAGGSRTDAFSRTGHHAEDEGRKIL